MRKLVLLLVVCILTNHFSTNARSPERVLVKGGKIMQFKKWAVVVSFEITKFEITNSQYASFLNAEKIDNDAIYSGKQIINVSSDDLQLEYKDSVWQSKTGKENYPMVMVNYYGAYEFCKWKGGKLPTETEWTYAAKGGRKNKNYIYAGSNKLDEVGWYKDNCEGHSHDVGKKKPNELGIYDMSGNSWEWCLNDTLKGDDDFCVHMGGSWYAGKQPSRINSHYGNTPMHYSNSVGFRVIFPVIKNKNRMQH